MNTFEKERSQLADEKAVLEKELASVGRINPSNPSDWEAVGPEIEQEADPNDAATLIEEADENAGILNDLEVRYNEVLDALMRIEKGTYGVCETGGEPIESARLAADPAARTCKKHLG
jgi:RNA polymerase-binding transcription factor DksA